MRRRKFKPAKEWLYTSREVRLFKTALHADSVNEFDTEVLQQLVLAAGGELVWRTYLNCDTEEEKRAQAALRAFMALAPGQHTPPPTHEKSAAKSLSTASPPARSRRLNGRDEIADTEGGRDSDAE